MAKKTKRSKKKSKLPIYKGPVHDLHTRVIPLNQKKPSHSKKAPRFTEDIEAIFDKVIFTNGFCSKNPGGEIGGGFVVTEKGVFVDSWFGGYSGEGTTNSSELNTINQALLWCIQNCHTNERVAITSKSEYAISAIWNWSQKWAVNGWKIKGKTVANVELVRESSDIIQKMSTPPTPFHYHLKGANAFAQRALFLSHLTIEEQESGWRRLEMNA